jgi:hypothetical protein
MLNPMDYICPKCGEKSESQEQADWHMQVGHFDPTPIPDEDFKSE